MKKVFENANEYGSSLDWKDLTMLKLSMLALGILIGMCIPNSARTAVLVVAVVVFVLTCIPQMKKFFGVWFQK